MICAAQRCKSSDNKGIHRFKFGGRGNHRLFKGRRDRGRDFFLIQYFYMLSPVPLLDGEDQRA